MSDKEFGAVSAPGGGSVEAVPAPRLPPAVGDIDVNFCKRPTCTNFGVPASLKKYARRASALASLPGIDYRLQGKVSGDRSTPLLNCLLCHEMPPIKSNHGIADELARMQAYLVAQPAVRSCPHSECANHGAPLPDKTRYDKNGRNSQGSQRYRCRACRKTFSVSERLTTRQRSAFKNRQVSAIKMIDVRWLGLDQNN